MADPTTGKEDMGAIAEDGRLMTDAEGHTAPPLMKVGRLVNRAGGRERRKRGTRRVERDVEDIVAKGEDEAGVERPLPTSTTAARWMSTATRG